MDPRRPYFPPPPPPPPRFTNRHREQFDDYWSRDVDAPRREHFHQEIRCMPSLPSDVRSRGNSERHRDQPPFFPGEGQHVGVFTPPPHPIRRDYEWHPNSAGHHIHGPHPHRSHSYVEDRRRSHPLPDQLRRSDFRSDYEHQLRFVYEPHRQAIADDKHFHQAASSARYGNPDHQGHSSRKYDEHNEGHDWKRLRKFEDNDKCR